MAKIVLAVFLTLATFALTVPTNTKRDEVQKEMERVEKESSIDKDNRSAGKELDTEYLMNMCNESFRIEMDYLKSLNESGSFLDETDKTPKCFIRCMLENTGVLLDDGQFDSERAAMVFAGERNGKPMEDLRDMTSACVVDRDEKCLCERSYNFLRCLMSMEIEKYGAQ